MTLTLDFSPEEEALLREKAARQGQDVSTYATGVLRRDLNILPVDEELAEGKSLTDFRLREENK